MTRKNRSKPYIVIIEDDAALTEVLSFNLEHEGYEVGVANDGLAGLRLARDDPPDLVILDLMMPTMDGIEVCREIRASKPTRHIPILMLTAKTDETNQIVGFKMGADDYVTKPFSLQVLMQRVRALLNRARMPESADDVIDLHGILLDRVGHQVSCGGEPVPLTRTEFRLLEAIMRHPGRAFSRADLLNFAIGDETIVLERTIDVHIRSLRFKLKEFANAIETVRGVGYRFAREIK